ncbi:MAG: reverse transcriptase domain-containing protein [Patescibacteria group bacterium]
MVPTGKLFGRKLLVYAPKARQKCRGGGGRYWKSFGHNIFEKIINLENLFLAWREFRRGKRSKLDVQKFEFKLEDNLFTIHDQLASGIYVNNPYVSFYITDPKLRHIHKASVRDRVINQAVFRVLYPIFDKVFAYDSYSCRDNKGLHKAVDRLELFLRRVSRNYQEPVWVLKCDVKKFFDSVDQERLFGFICKRLFDRRALDLVERIISSFSVSAGKGLPLGNVTSQLFANIYLNELDQFIKHQLRVKYYLRYCDDFIILDNGKKYLSGLIDKINEFLKNNLELELHPRKIIIRKYRQGIDYLGYVCLPHYRVPRTKTKRRILRVLVGKSYLVKQGRFSQTIFYSSLQSYFGVLKHCRGFKVKQQILSVIK